MPATEGTWREPFRRFVLGRSAWVYVAAASTFLALVVGLLLVARRAAGALSSSPRSEVIAFTALILIAWGWLVRLTINRSRFHRCQSLGEELRSPASAIAICLPTVAIAMIAIACSFPGGTALDWCVWLSALVAIVLGPRVVSPSRHSSRAVGAVTAECTMLQDLQRFRAADGCELVRGTLLAEFAPGDRNATIFIAFCPPFERLPEVEASASGGPAVTVKLAQVLHNGAQLDVRLSKAADCQQRVTVSLSAVEIGDPDPTDGGA